MPKKKGKKGRNAPPPFGQQRSGEKQDSHAASAPSLPKPSTSLSSAHHFGKLGSKIRLISNCFPIKLPSGCVYNYKVHINRMNTNLRRQDAEIKESENIKRKEKMFSTRNRKIVELLLKTYSSFENVYAAYDGMYNLYTRKELKVDFPLRCEVILPNENQGDDADPLNVRRDVFEVRINPAKKADTETCAISLDPLHDFFAGRISSIPPKTIYVIETILRHGPCLRFPPVGRSFFFPPNRNNLNPITGGLELWFGYHQSVRIGQWSSTVVINTTASTFYQEEPVLDFVARLADIKNLTTTSTLTEEDNDKISQEIKNRKCVVTHLNYQRQFCILKLTRNNARDLSFDMGANGNEQRTSVFEYFRQRHNIVLRFPNLPCVQMKPAEKNIFLPVEVCRFIPGQQAKTELSVEQKTAMINFTILSPEDKLKRIRSIRQKSDYEHDKCVQQFETKVSLEPLSLDGRVLDPPNIVYKNNKRIRPKNGSWNMRDMEFLIPARIQRWILINFESVLHESIISNFVDEFLVQGRDLGITINKPVAIQTIMDISNIEDLLRKAQTIADLAIIVLPRENRENIYVKIKYVSEIFIGFTTQCIKSVTIKDLKDKRDPKIVRDLWCKINLKLGGQNNHLFLPDISKIFKKPVIIIGADVNHPPSSGTSERNPSLAACVGSLNNNLTRFAVTVRPQVNVKGKKSMEEIVDLEDMVRELLLAYYKHTHLKPEKIIFYRDGVSNNQFQKVKECEIPCIRRSCKSLQQMNYEPEITFIIVQKRHHVRFFHQNSKQKVQNVPSGTVVDTEVTHKVNQDFYLSSHKPSSGTSRPSHYVVLEDDSHFSADELQNLTFQMCFVNARCTNSISIPAPVLYADLVAYRARMHHNGQQLEAGKRPTNPDPKGNDQVIPPDIWNGVKILVTLQDSMYFI